MVDTIVQLLCFYASGFMRWAALNQLQTTVIRRSKSKPGNQNEEK
jgi:TRAP-type C4-dicarboxylate transport system permease small subunit